MPRFSLVPSVLLLVTPVLCFPAAPAQAQFTYISQTRSVYAAWYQSPLDIQPAVEVSFTAPDFAPFNQLARAVSGAGTGGAANMTQQSRLDPLEMASVASSDVTPRSGRSVVQSVCDITFTLLSETPVRFQTFLLPLSSFDQHETTLSLAAGTTLLSSTTLPLDQTLTLAPGHYRWRQFFREDTTLGVGRSLAATLTVVPAPEVLAPGFVALPLYLRARPRRRCITL